jgi:hypothetical protein
LQSTRICEVLNLVQFVDLLKNDAIPGLKFSDVEKNFSQKVIWIQYGFISPSLVPVMSPKFSADIEKEMEMISSHQSVTSS